MIRYNHQSVTMTILAILTLFQAVFACSIFGVDIVTTHKGQRFVGTITSDTPEAVELTITITLENKPIPIPIRLLRSEVKEVLRNQPESAGAAIPESTEVSEKGTEPEVNAATATIKAGTAEAIPTNTPVQTIPEKEVSTSTPVPVETVAEAPTATPAPVDKPAATAEVVIPKPTSTPKEARKTEAPSPKATPVPKEKPRETEKPVSTTISENVEFEAVKVFRPFVNSEAAIKRIDNELLPLAPPPMPTGKCRGITANNLNLRVGPSTDYERVGSVSKGEVFLELAEEDGWFQGITSQGVEGWILGRYTEPLENQIIVITGDRVNFRQSPDTGAQMIRKLDRGELLLLLRAVIPPARPTPKPGDKPAHEEEYWVQARDADGKVGWLSAAYAAVVVNRSALIPRIFEPSDLSPEGLFAVTPGEAGDKARSKAKIEVTDLSLVRNGKIAVVVQYNGIVKSPDALLGLIDTAEEKDRVWRRSYRGATLSELGFDSKLIESIEGVVVAICKGKREGDKWVYELTVSRDAAQSTPEQPLDIKYGFVVQSGKNRGAIVSFNM